MSQGLTSSERKKIEKEQLIPPTTKAWDSSLHFCLDWDFMLISKHDPEAKACLCTPDYIARSGVS